MEEVIEETSAEETVEEEPVTEEAVEEVPATEEVVEEALKRRLRSGRSYRRNFG